MFYRICQSSGYERSVIGLPVARGYSTVEVYSFDCNRPRLLLIAASLFSLISMLLDSSLLLLMFHSNGVDGTFAADYAVPVILRS